jgi:hypothetical protein
MLSVNKFLNFQKKILMVSNPIKKIGLMRDLHLHDT